MTPSSNGVSTPTPPYGGAHDDALRHLHPSRSPAMALVAILGGTVCTAGGYGAAQVERVVHPRHCPTPLADADKPCSPACQPKQTCYKGTCIDVATSLLLRVQTLEERVDRLAGGDTVISAGSMR